MNPYVFARLRKRDNIFGTQLLSSSFEFAQVPVGICIESLWKCQQLYWFPKRLSVASMTLIFVLFFVCRYLQSTFPAQQKPWNGVFFVSCQEGFFKAVVAENWGLGVFLGWTAGPPSWDGSSTPGSETVLVDTGKKVYAMSNTWLKQVLNNALEAENYLCTDMYWLNCWLFFIYCPCLVEMMSMKWIQFTNLPFYFRDFNVSNGAHHLALNQVGPLVHWLLIEHPTFSKSVCFSIQNSLELC